MRIKTQEERELEQIVHKANKEGWVKPVCVKSGRLKGLVLHGKLKEDTPKHYREAWNRLSEIRRGFRLQDPPTGSSHLQ